MTQYCFQSASPGMNSPGGQLIRNTSLIITAYALVKSNFPPITCGGSDFCTAAAYSSITFSISFTPRGTGVFAASTRYSFRFEIFGAATGLASSDATLLVVFSLFMSPPNWLGCECALPSPACLPEIHFWSAAACRRFYGLNPSLCLRLLCLPLLGRPASE